MKKYILFPLLLIFLLTGCQISQTDYSKPYDYMSALNGRDYESLSTPEKKLVYSIPEDIAKSLSTEALLETILNNKYLIDLFAYDDFIMAVQSREVQFRIIEFLEREDSITVLESYISKYEKMVSENYSADTNRQLRFMKKVLDNHNLILSH